MAVLSNFDSVVQLAFGVNSLLYLYTTRPFLQKKTEEFLDDYHSQFEAYYENLAGVEEPVSGNDKEEISRSAPHKVRLWDKRLHIITTVFAVALTLSCLVILIINGFYRNLELPGIFILILLGLLFIPTPALTLLQYNVYRTIIKKELKTSRAG